MAIQGRLNTATLSLRSLSTFAAMSQPNTMMRISPPTLAMSFIMAVRRPDIGIDGISIPLTYPASFLKAFDEGHAPTQIPQLTQRLGTTTASSLKSMPSLRGRITTAS